MCLIVDTNLASLVFCKEPQNDFRPIIDWLLSSHQDPQKNGKLVVGGHLATEINRLNDARIFIRQLSQAGRARIIPKEITDEEAKKFGNYKSDDPHVIALARVSGARILCSHDKDLHKDFRNTKLINNPKGHIYQNARHKHLLSRYGHTEACKKSMTKNGNL